MILGKVRWKAAGFLPRLMWICFHHLLIVGLLQSSPVWSFTPNNLTGWKSHVSGLRRLLIAQSYPCFRGGKWGVGFSVCFWPGAAKQTHKQNEREREKPSKSDFQEFGNQPTSSEMSKKEKKWWKKTHSGEPRTYIKGLCKYWKYSQAKKNPSQTHLCIQTDDKLKEKTWPLELCSEEIQWLRYAAEVGIGTRAVPANHLQSAFLQKHQDVIDVFKAHANTKNKRERRGGEGKQWKYVEMENWTCADTSQREGRVWFGGGGVL